MCFEALQVWFKPLSDDQLWPSDHVLLVDYHADVFSVNTCDFPLPNVFHTQTLLYNTPKHFFVTSKNQDRYSYIMLQLHSTIC